MTNLAVPSPGKRCRCGARRDKAARRCAEMPRAVALPTRPPLPRKRATPRGPFHPAPQPAKGHALMTVTVPLVLIVAAVIYVAYRYMGLRVWQAVVCLVFGFLLAATTAAPEIRSLITGIVQWLSKP